MSKYYKKKGFYKKKGYNSKAFKKAVRREVWRLKETKHFEMNLLTYFGTVGASTWVGESVTGMITGGLGIDEREGNKIKAVFTRIRGVLEIGDATNVIRALCLVVNKDFDEDNPGIGLYETPGPHHEGIRGVLMDKLITMDEASKNVMKIDWKIKSRGTFYYDSEISNSESKSKMVFMMLSDSGAVIHPGFAGGTLDFYFKDC